MSIYKHIKIIIQDIWNEYIHTYTHTKELHYYIDNYTNYINKTAV